MTVSLTITKCVSGVIHQPMRVLWSSQPMSTAAEPIPSRLMILMKRRSTFQLTAYDERGNSSVSNTVSLTTPIFPPADIADLNCERLAGILRCNLTAVGDDTMRGYASRYIVRTVAHSALEEAELLPLCESTDDNETVCGSEAFDSALALGLVTDLDVPNLAQPTFPGYPQILDISMFLFTRGALLHPHRHRRRYRCLRDIECRIVPFRGNPTK